MIEFLRGRYVHSDIDYINKLFNVMTINELDLIANNNFDYLWEYIWMDKKFNKITSKIQKDYNSAEQKFNKIKEGYNINGVFINIKSLLHNSSKFGARRGSPPVKIKSHFSFSVVRLLKKLTDREMKFLS